MLWRNIGIALWQRRSTQEKPKSITLPREWLKMRDGGQASGYGQQDQGSFSKAQICERSLDFFAGQDIWRRAAFGALPNSFDGVAVAEVMTATVIEQQTHYIPYFEPR